MEVYSGVFNGTRAAFLMELELHELEFHANLFIYLFLSLITPYSIFYKSSFILKSSFKKGTFP